MVPFARDPENILFNPSQEEEANVRGEIHLPSGGGNIPSISAMDVETRDPPDRRGSQKKQQKGGGGGGGSMCIGDIAVRPISSSAAPLAGLIGSIQPRVMSPGGLDWLCQTTRDLFGC